MRRNRIFRFAERLPGRRGRESSGNLGADRPGGGTILLGWSAAVHFDRVRMQARKTRRNAWTKFIRSEGTSWLLILMAPAIAGASLSNRVILSF
jgi:hypothetical protein